MIVREATRPYCFFLPPVSPTPVQNIRNRTLDAAAVTSLRLCMFTQVYFHGDVLTVVHVLSFATLKQIPTLKSYFRHSNQRHTYHDHRVRSCCIVRTFVSFEASYLVNWIRMAACVLSHTYMMRRTRAVIYLQHLILPNGTMKRTSIQIPTTGMLVMI